MASTASGASTCTDAVEALAEQPLTGSVTITAPV